MNPYTSNYPTMNKESIQKFLETMLRKKFKKNTSEGDCSEAYSTKAISPFAFSTEPYTGTIKPIMESLGWKLEIMEDEHVSHWRK